MGTIAEPIIQLNAWKIKFMGYFGCIKWIPTKAKAKAHTSYTFYKASFFIGLISLDIIIV